MKQFFIILLSLIFSAYSADSLGEYQPQDGDMLFQSLPHGDLVDAIEGATHSPYSHCGIVEKKENQWFVLEAIGPVKFTPLSQWIAQGRQSKFDVYRLKASHSKKIPAIITAAHSFIGKPYDIHYSFDDANIYCSELLYKSTEKATGMKLGKLQKLGELDWKNHSKVIIAIEGRIPTERDMITPKNLAAADELEKVFSK